MKFFKQSSVSCLLSLFLSILVTGCVFQPSSGQPTTQPHATCTEEKNVANKHISMINEYKDYTNFSIENTRGLIRLLSDNFNIDSSECVDFTASVQSEAKDLFSTKRHLFLNPLRAICSQDVSLDSHNLVALSAQINEIKTSTSILKDLILVDTDSCTEIP